MICGFVNLTLNSVLAGADILTRQPLLCELGFASLGARKRVGVHKEIFTKITSVFLIEFKVLTDRNKFTTK